MRSCCKIMVLAGLTLAFLGSLQAADIAGKWHAEFDTQIGPQKYTYEFAVKADTITGKATYEREDQTGTVTLKDIKLKGNEISFTEPLEMGGQELTISYHGTVSSDKMELTRLVGEFATEHLVAKRVKAAPAASPKDSP